MGDLWFPVLSDFWPHGAAADLYGILRSDGTSERALFVIDKRGIIRYFQSGAVTGNGETAAMLRKLLKELIAENHAEKIIPKQS